MECKNSSRTYVLDFKLYPLSKLDIKKYEINTLKLVLKFIFIEYQMFLIYLWYEVNTLKLLCVEIYIYRMIRGLIGF